jgi:hypothetical protein
MINLILESIKESITYFASLMIMFCAFGYYYMINGRDRWQEGWETHLREAFLLQFNIIFGSF